MEKEEKIDRLIDQIGEIDLSVAERIRDRNFQQTAMDFLDSQNRLEKHEKFCHELLKKVDDLYPKIDAVVDHEFWVKDKVNELLHENRKTQKVTED